MDRFVGAASLRIRPGEGRGAESGNDRFGGDSEQVGYFVWRALKLYQVF